MSVIGERLREARKKIDISQAKLAKKIGVNRAYLSYIENGKASPTFDFVEKLAVGLEMPFESLVLGEDIRLKEGKSPVYEGLSELLHDRATLLQMNPTREELTVLKSIRLDPRFAPSKKFFIEALLDYRKAKNSSVSLPLHEVGGNQGGVDSRMTSSFKKLLWQQFGGSMDMLENAINACPEEVWSGATKMNLDKYHEYWYMVFHTLFWLDLYLSDNGNEFHPHAPFTLGELDAAGVLPDRIYTKTEMLSYLAHCREKCRLKINSLTDKDYTERFIFMNFDLTIVELQFYNMRHVQHHAAQLNLILRQTIDSAPRWVRRTIVELNK